MERDYEGETRTHRADLADPAWVGRTAGERAVRRLDATRAPTGRATIVYDPRVSAGIVGHVAGAANGAAIARKTSFLLKKLGERILPEGVTITDDPFRRRGQASRAFDGEGVTPIAFDLVRDGVLTTWFLDSASAREIGLSTNGHASRGGGNPSPGPTNLTLLPGRQSPEELIAAIGTGLYVTELIGHGVNGITGDYSRGAAGFLIENGKLGRAFSEATIAGNLLEMLPRMTVANDLKYRYATNAPTLAIEGMTVAGR
jgi:PmbA protein